MTKFSRETGPKPVIKIKIIAAPVVAWSNLKVLAGQVALGTTILATSLSTIAASFNVGA